MSPTVFPEYRRHGVGRALMDAAVTFAEECRRTPRVDRGALRLARRNRFMARLGLGPTATLRIAPTTAVRAKLTAQRLPVARPTRHLTHVLAVRRSMRRRRHQSWPAQSSAKAATNRAQRTGSSVSPVSRHHSQ